MKSYYLVCASAFALCYSSNAYAQSGATANSGPALEEIVVTAERRSETLQRSSVAMEVVPGDIAQKITNPQDLTTVAPGVQVASSGTQPNVYIRGVGDQTGNSRGQAAVAFNVDGVYYARSNAAGAQMFDMERIELLKGPQGTLYGRNASGGAINIITAAPKLGVVNGYVGGEVGSYNLWRGDAAVNAPIGDTAALRVAGHVVKRNGYLSDGGEDEDTQSLRARFLWKPSQKFSLLLNGDVSKLGGIGLGYAIYPAINNDKWRGARAQPLPWPYQFNASTAPYTQPNDAFQNVRNKGLSAQADIDLGFATLTVIPAWRKQDSLAAFYGPNFRYSEDADTKQASGEARLSRESARLKWVLGVYYFDEELDQSYSSVQNTLKAGHYDASRQAWAGFFQGTVSVTDRLRLIGGIRYTTETVNGDYDTGTGAIGLFPYARTTVTTTIVPIKSNRTNYKVGAEFDVAPTSMLFATYATGFKAGGFVPTTSCGADIYKPEEISALTVGLRNRFLENRLQANVEVFDWKLKDQQVTAVTLDPCGATIGQFISNPGDASIKGANLDLVFKLTAADTLRASVEYTDATYDRFSSNQFGIGVYAPAYGTRCVAKPAGGSLFNANCEGQQLPRTPKWAGTMGYEHRFELGAGNLVFGANAQLASSRWLDYAYMRNSKAPGYTVINAELTYNSPKNRWAASVYGNNLTNEAVYTGGSDHTVLAPNGAPYLVATIQRPRVFGARLRYNFGG
jgi:iron complex outermembrane receptor protein